MAHADAVAVAVPANRDNGERMVGELDGRCGRERAAVQALEAVCLDEMGQLAAAAHARNHRDFVRHPAGLHKRLFERDEDGKITATGAPADGVRGFGQFSECCHAITYSEPMQAFTCATISAGSRGRAS